MPHRRLHFVVEDVHHLVSLQQAAFAFEAQSLSQVPRPSGSHRTWTRFHRCSHRREHPVEVQHPDERRPRLSTRDHSQIHQVDHGHVVDGAIHHLVMHLDGDWQIVLGRTSYCRHFNGGKEIQQVSSHYARIHRKRYNPVHHIGSIRRVHGLRECKYAMTGLTGDYAFQLTPILGRYPIDYDVWLDTDRWHRPRFDCSGQSNGSHPHFQS